MNELALFNDLFDGFGDDGFLMPSFNYKKAFASPKVDVKEDKDAYIMDMDLPGKTDKDISIEFKNNVLTISSENKSEKEEKKEEKAQAKEAPKYLIKERSYTKFSRSFSLPDDVEADKITAKVENGVLEITMPRKAIEEAHKIAITAA
ncbi:MAG: Hsp20/alpha crystallin family protein [Treponema sp.]|nr:Hsp20/alpha crystallin family protein [Treponema sp.]